MSLAAVVALGLSSSAFAVDFGGVKNVKASGQAKLWYETADVDGASADLFDQASSSGQAMLKLAVTGNYGDAMGFGLTTYAVDTLGLENNVVSNVRMGGDAVAPESILDTQWWFGEAYITYKMGNTIAKIGRQELDTPLAYSENWNIAPNTFDAAVLLNSDLPNTTLVAAYVGRGNGIGCTAGTCTVSYDGDFSTYVADGAYAFAILNQSIPNVPVNIWYYDVQDVADAVWIDAHGKIGPVSVGAIYANLNPKASGTNDTDAYAFSVAGDIGQFNLMAAYSSVDEDGVLPVANTATGFKKTKLPTAGVYSDGNVVAQPGADSWKIKASTKVAGIGVTAQYISSEMDGTNADSNEFDLIVSTKIADIDVKAIYMNRDHEFAYGGGELAVPCTHNPL